MRARGLKRDWTWANYAERWSRPMRARGLKHLGSGHFQAVSKSRPMRARGLKHPGQISSPGPISRAPCGRVD